MEQATFAGGCFWCMQGPFDAEPGVVNVAVGYSGGTAADATYMAVASHRTKHREAIHMQFDPNAVTYRRLVEIFFRQIDPTDPGGQFGDRGFQYTTAVFYHTPEQQQIAQNYVAELNASCRFNKPIATLVIPFETFYPAEDEHQQYYKKQPFQYQMYKRGSGRADYIHKNWE